MALQTAQPPVQAPEWTTPPDGEQLAHQTPAGLETQHCRGEPMSIYPLLPMPEVEAEVSTVRSGRGVLRNSEFVVIVCVPLPGLESNVQDWRL